MLTSDLRKCRSVAYGKVSRLPETEATIGFFITRIVRAAPLTRASRVSPVAAERASRRRRRRDDQSCRRPHAFQTEQGTRGRSQHSRVSHTRHTAAAPCTSSQAPPAAATLAPPCMGTPLQSRGSHKPSRIPHSHVHQQRHSRHSAHTKHTLSCDLCFALPSLEARPSALLLRAIGVETLISPLLCAYHSAAVTGRAQSQSRREGDRFLHTHSRHSRARRTTAAIEAVRHRPTAAPQPA